MDYPIPIRAEHLTRDELGAVLVGLPDGATVDPTESAGPMMFDPETVALLVDAAKILVPSLITGIATVWVAYVNTRKKDAVKPSPQPPIVIIIETNRDAIPITIDTADIAASVAAAQLPASVTEITRVRLQG